VLVSRERRESLREEAEVTFPPLPSAEAGTRLSDPEGCKAELT